MSEKKLIIEAAQAAAVAQRAHPNIASWRIADTIKDALDHDPARDTPTELEAFVLAVFGRHRLLGELEGFVAVCDRHAGRGLRRVRRLRSRAAGLLKTGAVTESQLQQLVDEFRCSSRGTGAGR